MSTSNNSNDAPKELTQDDIFYELEDFCYGSFVNNLQGMTEIIDSFPSYDVNYVPNDDEDTLLFKCAKNLRYDEMKMLVSKGAILNHIGASNYDALTQVLITWNSICEQLCVLCDDRYIWRQMVIFDELCKNDDTNMLELIYANTSLYGIYDLLKSFFEIDEIVKIINKIVNKTFVGQTQTMNKIINMFLENGYDINKLLTPDNVKNLLKINELSMGNSHFCFDFVTCDSLKYLIHFGISVERITELINKDYNKYDLIIKMLSCDTHQLYYYVDKLHAKCNNDNIIEVNCAGNSNNYYNDAIQYAKDIAYILANTMNDISEVVEKVSKHVVMEDKYVDQYCPDNTQIYVCTLIAHKCMRHLNYDLFKYISNMVTPNTCTKNASDESILSTFYRMHNRIGDMILQYCEKCSSIEELENLNGILSFNGVDDTRDVIVKIKNGTYDGTFNKAVMFVKILGIKTFDDTMFKPQSVAYNNVWLLKKCGVQFNKKNIGRFTYDKVGQLVENIMNDKTVHPVIKILMNKGFYDM
jgi:hypothetical protein